MLPDYEKVLTQALQLTREQKCDLIDALEADVAKSNSLPFHESWFAEAERRFAVYDAGNV